MVILIRMISIAVEVPFFCKEICKYGVAVNEASSLIRTVFLRPFFSLSLALLIFGGGNARMLFEDT